MMARDPEKQRRARRDSYHRHAEKIGRGWRERRTGFSPELVEQLRELQQGRCGICGVEMKVGGRQNHCETADHHEPEGVKTPRGLLCRLCNRDLGVYEKMKRLGAEAYLSSPPAQRARETD